MDFKHLLAVALVTVIVVGGCETTGSETRPVRDLAGTSWLATDIGGKGVTDGVRPTLTFAEPGKVAGTGGCNRFFGAVTVDGPSVEFGKMGSTMMACPPPLMEQEKRYLDALGEAKRFEVRDGMLLIFGDGPSPIIRFSEMEAEGK